MPSLDSEVVGTINHSKLSGSLMDTSGFWCMPGERYLLECIVQAVKVGGGRIKIWGCFSGFRPLVPQEDNVHATVYTEILGNCLLHTAVHQLGDGDSLFFSVVTEGSH